MSKSYTGTTSIGYGLVPHPLQVVTGRLAVIRLQLVEPRGKSLRATRYRPIYPLLGRQLVHPVSHPARSLALGFNPLLY